MFKFTSAICIFIVLKTACSEPPRLISRYPTRFQRLEAPYQPSGWKPSGPEFKLPNEPVPHTVYGPPPQEYGPPPQEYGPPIEITTEAEVTTTEIPTTTEQLDVEGVNGRNSKLVDSKNKGVYYIYHPTGLLQKVVYSSRNDRRRMEFLAKLKYEDVEPIRGPIYTYDEGSQALRRL